jgi:two-component system, NarL family, response regulator LiaR
MPRTRLLIVDDHAIIRRGLRQLILETPEIELVGEAQDGQEAVEIVRQLKPEVILMDIQMPVLDGIEATRKIIAEYPQTGIIMLTVQRNSNLIFEAITAGARGYLLKDADEEALMRAILAVSRGEALIDSGIAAQVLDEFRRLSQSKGAPSEFEKLTDAEMDILRLVAQGEENPAIAQDLAISEKTVGNRLTTIYQKLHVNNRTQAALYALRQGWVPLEPNGE